jgi:outer membrane protein OmpU
MKKVLFATTALVATAGVAAADVTFGGYGRFGVLYNSTAGDDNVLGTADDVSSTDVTSRFRLQIDTTAESDSGVTIGARTRINQDGGGSGTGLNGVRFFARTGGLEVGVGNIFGALEFMPGMYPVDLGLTGLGYDYTAFNFNGDAYSSGGAGASQQNGLEVMYKMGDLSMHLSASDGGTTYNNNTVAGNDVEGAAADGVDRDRVAAHIAYTYSGFTFALGGQDSADLGDTELAASVAGKIGMADVTLAYADNGTSGDQVTLAASFDVGAATQVDVYYADRSGATRLRGDDGADDAVYVAGTEYNGDSFGIGFHHNLGGGTSLRGGVARQFTGVTRADLGVRFNF